MFVLTGTVWGDRVLKLILRRHVLVREAFIRLDTDMLNPNSSGRRPAKPWITEDLQVEQLSDLESLLMLMIQE
jgi:hypothetical protein